MPPTRPPTRSSARGWRIRRCPLRWIRNPRGLPLAALARQTFARRTPQSKEIPSRRPRARRAKSACAHASRHRGIASRESLCVMFLQDLRELEARIRTEKLAAMGRMSAAVAHEIRNPLAAITQASALLGEDLVDPAHRQLDDDGRSRTRSGWRASSTTCSTSRGPGNSACCRWANRSALDPTVRSLAEEWVAARAAARCAARARRDGQRRALRRRAPAPHPREPARQRGALCRRSRRFDPGQHAHERGRRPCLQIWSDGAPLEPAVQRHLFEPFFSSESRSSGLGLFLCRELCERHGATIGYERRALSPAGPEGNEFFVAFAAAETRLTQ